MGGGGQLWECTERCRGWLKGLPGVFWCQSSRRALHKHKGLQRGAGHRGCAGGDREHHRCTLEEVDCCWSCGVLQQPKEGRYLC